MECLLPYLSMVTVPHIMVRLERMLDYRGVGLARFHCTGIPQTERWWSYHRGGIVLRMARLTLVNIH